MRIALVETVDPYTRVSKISGHDVRLCNRFQVVRRTMRISAMGDEQQGEKSSDGSHLRCRFPGENDIRGNPCFGLGYKATLPVLYLSREVQKETT